MDYKMYDNINKRLDFLEFRQELIFENSTVARLLFEYKITKEQYSKLMDLMNEIRESIENQSFTQKDHIYYEKRVKEITDIEDYHFAEYFAKNCWEDNRWEEVFESLYGGFEKYKNLIQRKKEGNYDY